jgi:hypothetical protein
MAKQKVLIAVTTYPMPSRSHDELVCTAGLLENGQWIRIYPVPLSFLRGIKINGEVKQVKYTWFELELRKRTDDFRPESHSPIHYDFRDLVIHETIDTKSNWFKRKEIALKNVYTDMDKLIKDSNAPTNISLATFKPTTVKDLVWEEDAAEWKDEWKDLRKQGDLFSGDKEPEILIPKLPYKFYYRFTDETGKKRRLMIEDWEIGALYFKCLRDSEGNVAQALEKVKDQYERNFINNKDLYFFLGTTKKWHMRRGNNPFVIIGVFYPKKESQTSLF